MATDASSVDLVLSQLGSIGLYQTKVYTLSCLPVFIAGALTSLLVFATAVPSHRFVRFGFWIFMISKYLLYFQMLHSGL